MRDNVILGHDKKLLVPMFVNTNGSESSKQKRQSQCNYCIITVLANQWTLLGE